MRIALDLRRIKNPGIGRYMKCLTEALLSLETEHEFLLLLPPDALEMISIAGRRAEKICCASPYYSVREQIELPRILRRHNVDLLHSPHFVLPLRCPCTTAVTIHDVIYLACKEDLPSLAGRLYYRGMMTASARMADRIITDSQFSKQEIIRWLKLDARIEVIQPGIDQVFQPVTDLSLIETARSRFGIRKDFILYTGIYKPRKNHAGLLRSFARLLTNGISAQLVIAGPMNQGERDLKRLAAELQVAKEVVFTGFIEDSDLAALYSAARVYACPSLYEGFGFTVLEAQACGAPVVCSTETSLPEVAGDGALFADARDPERFAVALAQVFADGELRAGLTARGFENCRRFSWTKTATQTLAAYEHAVYGVARKAVYA